MIKTLCNRCQAPANTITRIFEVDNNIHLEVIARSTDKALQPHICEGCLAELLMASVETFETSKVVTSFHTAFRTAADLESAREEIEQLKLEKTDLLKRAAKTDDSMHELAVKFTKANEQVDLLTQEARKAKVDAEKFIKTKQAEIRQRIEDEKNDPEYVAAVERRERIRSSR